MSARAWEIVRDLARPYWPGVLLVGPAGAFVKVEAGEPVNFADSNALAERLRDGLSVPPSASPRA